MILVDQNGKFFEVAEADLQKAANAGYRVPAPDELAAFNARREAGSVRGTVRGGLEAVARGASLGLSDPLLKAAYPQEAAGMSLRREESPVIATVGELGGALATAPLTAGAGVAVAGRVGLQGVARVAMREAVQGGLWGMGTAISEASLGNTELSGQNLAAGALAGGFTNAALGVGFHGVGRGVSALTKKAGLASLSGTLKEAADTAEWKMLTRGRGEWAEKNRAFKQDILRTARDHGIFTAGASLEDPSLARRAADVMDDVWQGRIAPLLRATEAARPLTPGVAAALHADVESAVASFARNPVYDTAVKRVLGILDGIDDRAAQGNFRWDDLYATQSTLRQAAETTDVAAKPVLDRARHAMRDFIEDAAEKALPAQKGEFKAAIKDYASAARLEDALTAQLRKAEAAGPIGLTEIAGAGAFGMVTGSPVLGIAAGVGGKVLRPRGGFIAGAALRGLESSGMLKKVADTFEKRIFPMLGALPFAVRNRLADAAARGSVEFLAEHARLAQSDPSYLATLGLQDESPEEVENLGPRLAALQAANDASEVVSAAITSGVEGFFGAPGRPPSPRRSQPSVKEFGAIMGAISDVLQAPEDVYVRLPPDITAHAPMTAASAAATVVQAARFLDAKAPKDPNAGLPSAIKRPWEPSRTDLNRWFRYLDAIENPGAVIARARSGTVAPEHIEALQAVYPLLLEEARAKMVEILGQWDRPLPYHRRVGLSAFLGPSVFGMSNQQMQILQMGATVAPEVPSGAPDGRQVVDAEKNMQTQAQRLEGRGQ